jgi:hypothetical protein
VPARAAAAAPRARILATSRERLGIGPDQRFRIRSNVFSITVPENNLFGIDAGTYSPAIDDGFYVMLNPLGVGAHTVQFQGASGGCPLIGGPFSAIVTYELTVVPVTLH